jgi:hypothetical protein
MLMACGVGDCVADGTEQLSGSDGVFTVERAWTGGLHGGLDTRRDQRQELTSGVQTGDDLAWAAEEARRLDHYRL